MPHVCYIECFANRHIHVEVAVGSKSADESDLRFIGGECLVLIEQGFFINHSDRVVGNIVFTGEAGMFFKTNGVLVSFPGGEVLVLGDAGVGHIEVRVVHDGGALVIASGANFLEGEGAVAKAAVSVAKISIQWARVEDMMVGRAIDRLERGFQGDADIRMV